ncbi:glutathione S-transferase family protein [uncultured Parvibaculum sp.]|uniref:glutathione S-transferase family protein n=1 Tax=uncultured Parvibaculum sp. TaxID=291828 RepID=UPI0030DCE093|tara:strand:+ start:58337 stop:58954 length:618 start_codon:yes stop_codon:yes gene_type:complete
MKFYNSIGPNPRVVKMFMQEKGVTLPFVEVDLMAGENRQEPYLAKNPAGQSPALELDDGTVLAEITAICEYLDEKFPGGSLIGTTPEERAETRMWTRRVDLNICEPMANGFRFAEGLPLFQNRMRCLPEAAAGLKAIAQDKLAWLDKLMNGRDFLAGKRLTMADILLFGFLDFGASVGQPINPELKNVSAWFERMKARPSAAASA